MTVYIEKNNLTLLAGSSDPDGDPITVRRIDGVLPPSWPHTISLGIGSVEITEAGIVTYDDSDDSSQHPGLGETTLSGSFSFTLWDGQSESPTYTSTITLNGVDVASVPQSAFIHLGDPTDAANMVLNGNEIEQWNDVSGNGHHATQPDASKRPVRVQDSNLSWCAQQTGDQHLILNGLPADTPFHLAIGLKTSDTQGNLLRSLGASYQPYAIQWYTPGGISAIQVDTTYAIYDEIRANSQTFTNINSKEELGVEVIDGVVISVKNLNLRGYNGNIWEAVRLLYYEDGHFYNVEANVYSVIAFTDWNEAGAAEAYLAMTVGSNTPPTDTGEDLEFNVGSAQ